MSQMPSEAGRATHSRRWLDYFSPANLPRKNQTISANAENFGLILPYDFLNKVVF
jgi:hypothetical protein